MIYHEQMLLHRENYLQTAYEVQHCYHHNLTGNS